MVTPTRSKVKPHRQIIIVIQNPAYCVLAYFLGILRSFFSTDIIMLWEGSMDREIEEITTGDNSEVDPSSVFVKYYVDRYSNPPFGKEENGGAIKEELEEILRDTSVFSGIIYDDEELNPAGFLLARSGETEEMINQFENDYRKALDINLYGFDSIDLNSKRQHVEILSNILRNSLGNKYGRVGYIMDLGLGKIGDDWIDGDSLHEFRKLIKYFYNENHISTGFWIIHEKDYSVNLVKFSDLKIESIGKDGKIEAFIISI